MQPTATNRTSTGTEGTNYHSICSLARSIFNSKYLLIQNKTAVGWGGTKLKDVARVSFAIQQTQAHSHPAVPHLFSFCIFATVKCS